ncbi:MAG: ribbon-helix-helix domain-containing protein [Pedobacter sp.]|uniref:ribbon-helix-helix domain-containing protein n=1 Tax=Pedobacter sp. TaxID=1411316 RepID=UPI003569A7EB
MKRFNYHLTDEQANWLSAHSKGTGLSKAELIRRAIDEYRWLLIEKAQISKVAKCS